MKNKKSSRLLKILGIHTISVLLAFIVFLVFIQLPPFKKAFDSLDFYILSKYPYKIKESKNAAIFIVESRNDEDELFSNLKVFWNNIIFRDTLINEKIDRPGLLVIVFPLEFSLFRLEELVERNSFSIVDTSGRHIYLRFLWNIDKFSFVLDTATLSNIFVSPLLFAKYSVWNDSGVKNVKPYTKGKVRIKNSYVSSLSEFLTNELELKHKSFFTTIVEPLPFEVLKVRKGIDTAAISTLEKACEEYDTVFVIFYPEAVHANTIYSVYHYDLHEDKLIFDQATPLSYLMGFHIWSALSGVEPHKEGGKVLVSMIIVSILIIGLLLRYRSLPYAIFMWALLSGILIALDVLFYRNHAAFMPNLTASLFFLLLYFFIVVGLNTWNFVKSVEHVVSSMLEGVPLSGWRFPFERYCAGLLQLLKNVEGLEIDGEGQCFKKGADPSKLQKSELSISRKRKLKIFFPWDHILSPDEHKVIKRFIDLIREEEKYIETGKNEIRKGSYFDELEALSFVLDRILSYTEILREVLDGSPMGAAIIDPIGRILYVNAAFMRFLGVDKSRIEEGETLLGVFKDTFLENVIKDVSEFLASADFTGKVNFYREVNDHKAKRVFELLIVRFFKEGTYRGSVVILFDLTPFKKGKKAIEIAWLEIGHELNTIKTGIEYALKMHLSSKQLEQDEFVRIAFRTLDRLGDAVSKIKELFILREEVYEEERMGGTKEVISVSEVINSAEFRDILDSCPMKLIIEVSDKAKFYGNKRLFVIALKNLIDNAIKYGKERVRIYAERARDKVVVEVENDGPKIPPDKREEIFEPFKRLAVNGKTHNSKPGVGLGLAIVREIVEEVLGGRIYVIDGEILNGAKFVMEFPAAKKSK